MSAEAVAQGPAFELSFVDGRGVIGLREPLALGPLALHELELEIPDLRFPVDISGGVRLFRHKRCALRRAELRLDVELLGAWLEQRASGAGLALSGFKLRLHPGGLFELDGVVQLGGGPSPQIDAARTAEFLFRGRIEPLLDGGLRVRLLELRFFGPFPLPAPLVANGLLVALGARPGAPEGSAGASPFAASLVGCCEVDVNPLAVALLHGVAPAGWRLPERDGAPLAPPLSEQASLRLSYGGDDALGQAPRSARYIEQLGAGPELFADEERLLLESSPAAALEAYEARRSEQPKHPFAAERALALALSDPDHDDETLALAARIELHLPELPGLAATRAIVALRREEHHEAATQLRLAATLASVRGYPREELLARRAAGRAALAGGDPAAVDDYQRVLALDPDDGEALLLLGRLYAEQGDWQQLVTIRERQVELCKSPEARANALIALGELFRVHLDLHGAAKERFEQALQIDQRNEAALRGLLETCIEADEPRQGLEALDRLCELAAERADSVGELPLELRAAALLTHLDQPAEALRRVERALQLDARSVDARRRAAELSIANGRPLDALEHLHVLLELHRNAEERLVVHRQLGTLYLHASGDLDAAADQIECALALDELDVESLLLRRELAERIVDEGLLHETLERLAEACGPGVERAGVLLQLGTRQAVSGNAKDAEATLARATEHADDDGFAALRELALLYQRNDELDLAADAWRRALATATGIAAPDAWRSLAITERQRGAWAEARDALLEALAHVESERRRLTVLDDLELVYAQLGDSEARLELLEMQLEPLLAQLGDVPSRSTGPVVPLLGDGVPRRAAVLGEIAELREEIGDIDGALRALEQASELAPGALRFLERRADVHELIGAWPAAQQVLEQALERAQGEDRARLALRLGQVAAQQSHERSAIEHYGNALAWGLPPAQVELAWRRIVDLHLRRGDPVAAAEAGERAAESREQPEERAEQLFRAGLLWLKSAARIEDARRCLRQAVELWPRHRRALDSLESLAKQHDDGDELVRVLRLKVEAAAEQPQVQKALLVRLAEALAELGRDDEAQTAMTHALRLDEQHLPALLFAARSALAHDEPDDAAAYYQRIAQALPDAPLLTDQHRTAIQVETHLALARRALDAQEPANAEGHLETALAADPQQLEALRELDQLLGAQGRPAEQLELKRRLAELVDDHEHIALLGQQAELLLGLGRVDEAIACLTRLLEREPAEQAVLAKLEALLREAGQRRRLLELSVDRARRLDAAGSSTAEAWHRAADVAMELDDDLPLREALEAGLEAHPGDLELLSRLLEVTGPEDSARPRLLAQLFELQSDGPDAADTLAELLELSQSDELRARALELSASALRRSWAGARQQRDHARVLVAAGRRDDAAALYERMLHGDEQDARLLAARQLLQLTEGEVEREALANAVLALAPDDEPAAEALGLLLSSQRRFGELVSLLRKRLALTEGAEGPGIARRRSDLQRHLASALDASGRAGEAAGVLREAIDEAEPAQLTSLLACCRELALDELALTCLFRAAPRRPRDDDDAVLVLELSDALIDSQRAGEAIDRLRDLLGRDDLSAETRLLAAERLLAHATESDARLLALRTLAQQDAANDAQRQALAFELARAGEHIEAATLATELLAEDPTDLELEELRRQQLAAAGAFDELAQVLVAAAGASSNAGERARLLREAARAWAQRGGALEQAIRCLLGAASADSGGEAVDEATELFASLGAWESGAQGLEQLAEAPGLTRRDQSRALDAAATLRQRIPDPEGAATLLRRAIERDPTNLASLDRWVDVRRQRGAGDELAQALEQRAAQRQGADRAEDLVEAAELRADSEPTSAAELLEQLRALPRDPERSSRAIEVWLRLERPERAEEELLELAELPGHAEPALRRAAGLAHLRGDAAAERRYLGLLAKRQPDSLLSERLQEAYRAAGDLVGLKRALEQLAEHDPGARLELAELCASPLDALDESYDLFRQLLDGEGLDRPQRVRVHEGLAAVCERQGLHLEQAEQLGALRELLPRQARARRGALALRRARVLAERAEARDAALEAARQATEELGAGQAWAKALRLVVRLAPPEEGLDALELLLQHGHARDDELAALGRLARTFERDELAVRSFSELLRRDISHRCGAELVALLEQQDRTPEAAELLEQRAAAALTRTDSASQAADLLLDLAARRGALGQPDRRLAALRQAAAACPGRRDVVEVLLAELRQRGDEPALARALEEQLVTARGSLRLSLLEELAAVHEREGQLEQATVLREEILRLAPHRRDLLLPLLDGALAAGDAERARALLGRSELDPAEGRPRILALARLEIDAGALLAARERLEDLLTDAGDEHVIGAWTELGRLGRLAEDPLLVGRAELELAERDHERCQQHLRQGAAALEQRSAGRESAEAAYRRLLELDPGDTDSWRRLEALLRQGQDQRRLVATLRQRAEAQPTLERWLSLEQLEGELGDDAGAEASLRRAITLDPTALEALERLATRLRRRHALGELRELWTQLLERSPSDAGGGITTATRRRYALQLAALLERDLDDTAGAAEWLARAVAMDPEHLEAPSRLAALRRRLGDPSGAAELLSQLVERVYGEERAQALAELAELQLTDLGDQTAAAESFAAAFAVAPQMHDVGLRAAELHRDLGQLDAALAVLDTMRDAGSTPAVHKARARVLLRLERFDEASESYQLALDQDDPELHFELGMLLRRLGDDRRAAAHLARAADELVEPLLAAEAAHACGQALARLGLGEAALQRHQQATERDPVLRPAWEAIASLAAARDEDDLLERALEALEATSVAPRERAALRRQRGEVALQRGDTEQARRWLEASLDEHPGQPEVLAELRQLHAVRADWGACAELLRRQLPHCHDDVERASLHRELGVLLERRLDRADEGLEQLRLACSIDASPDNRQAQLAALDRHGKHLDAARLAAQLADELSGEARRACQLRGAINYQRAEQPEVARKLYEQLSAADDAIAEDARQRLQELANLQQLKDATKAEQPQAEQPGEQTSDEGDWKQEGPITRPLPRAPDVLEQLRVDGAWPQLVEELQARIFASRDPHERSELLIALADALEHLARDAEAFDALDQAARLAPEMPGLLVRAAELALRLRRHGRARELYDQLWESDLDFDRADVAFRRGGVYEAMGYEATANHCYAEAVELRPDHREALEARARLALYRDDPQTAIDVLLALGRTISPTEPHRLAELRVSLGELYLVQGDVRAARKRLESALTLDQHNDKALRLLLAVYEQLEDHRAAADVAQQLALQLDDPLVRASLLHHRAMLLGTHLGEEEDAINCLLKAYDIAPHHVPTLWRLVDFYWAEGDLTSVAEMGADLARAEALPDQSADTRLACIALAELAAGERERAAAMLSGVFAAEPRPAALLAELARGVAMGIAPELVAELVCELGQATSLREAELIEVDDARHEAALGQLLEALASG
jgi:tetratricopeptide (TPR) repeat protein